MKSVRKRLSLLLSIGIIVCGISGCGQMATKPLSVWMIVKSTQTEFWQAAFAGANAAKAEYNLDLTIYGPKTEEEYEAQNENIVKAVESGADAIVISAISYTENARAIDQAIDAGVKVVVIDSDVASSGVSARIGTDNIQAGRMACRAALNTYKQELVVGIINFDAGVRNGQEREKGFREILYQNERVKQIYTIHVLANAENAKEQTITLLKEHPEINVLVSFNEPLTVGAAHAVKELNLQQQVRFVGFDTNLECIDMMQTGVISALVVQNPYAMGYLGVETAWKLLNDEDSYKGENIATPALVVTSETMFTTECQKLLFPFG